VLEVAALAFGESPFWPAGRAGSTRNMRAPGWLHGSAIVNRCISLRSYSFNMAFSRLDGSSPDM
jgi:hypothetical protein